MKLAPVKQSGKGLSLQYRQQYKSMTEISNFDPQAECYHQQVIRQQQTLIQVLKQQVMRLQLVVIDVEKQRDEQHALYKQSLEHIETLNQKIEQLRQNNESIMHTLQAFQRQFVKRDYKIVLTSPKNPAKQSFEGPLFFQLIRTVKMKFLESANEPIIVAQKSFLSDYYGFFLSQEVQSAEMQLYNEVTQNKIKLTKLKNYGKKNYFNEKFRHCFWFIAHNNTLKITQKYYDHLLDILDGNRQNQNRKTSIIDLDLRRMDLKVQQSKADTMKVQIKKCLQLFTLYRPDIGYVQGMSYIAWMLLIRMEGFQAFTCFSNIILCDPFINSLYFFKGDNINKIIKFFDECLEDKKPKLHKHMKNLLVQFQLFLIEWAFTMFTRAFSLRLSSKIWDMWLCEGYNTFFKAGMAIMDSLEAEILQQKQNDKIIDLIRTQTQKIDQAEFLRNLQKQKLFQQLKL